MRIGAWHKALLLLGVLHLPVLAAVLYFTSGSSRSASPAQPTLPPLVPTVLAAAPPRSSLTAPAPLAGSCPACGFMVDPTSGACPRCRWAAARQAALPLPAAENEAAPAAATAATAMAPLDPGGSLPSPLQQSAASKEFIEGHWLGLETIPLSPELAREYRIPEDERGILVDEVTLEAAESGIQAGDLVHAIEGHLTPDLREFFLATQKVRQRSSATVEVRRGGRTLAFRMQARNAPELGFAQMEAAQPIVPGSISPHRSRHRPCTDCHVIMSSGGQLPTDNGDILPTPGSISSSAVAPHRPRGPCSSCHRILSEVAP